MSYCQGDIKAQMNKINKDKKDALDGIEKVLIMDIKQVIKQTAKREITDLEAKNILAKIGTRIMFGKQHTDKILNPSK